jgi:hypothetical protein
MLSPLATIEFREGSWNYNFFAPIVGGRYETL